MIEAVMAGLVRANLALAAGVLVAWALRRPVRRLFGARAAYALWAAAPLAAAAVLLPQPQAPTPLDPIVMTVTAAATGAAPAPAPAQGAPPTGLWLGLWLAGALSLAAVMARRQRRFLAEARAGRAGPAVVGALRPVIVLPADFATRFDAEEQAVVLSHERAHLAGGDAAFNALAAAIQCLCWFNPLAHLGVRWMRIDQELACDAQVLARHPGARRTYAEALLKTQLAVQALPLGCHWPPAAAHALKERIMMLRSPVPGRARRTLGLALILTTAGSGAVAAWAAQPSAQGAAAPAPTWAKVANAVDVAREFPAYALARGLTADVELTCGHEGARLVGCQGTVYPDQPLPHRLDGAFEAAAVRVAERYELAPQAQVPAAIRLTIPFRAEPTLTGGPPGAPYVRRPPAGPPPRLSDAARAAEARRHGDVAPNAPATIASPAWLEKPLAEDIRRLYPAEAANQGISAMVLLTCRVGGDGRFDSCAVLRSEAEGPDGPAPEAAGDFGAASLRLALLFKMAPEDAHHAQTKGGIVRIPVRWMTPKAAPAS